MVDLSINDALSGVAALAATVIAIRQKLRDDLAKEKDQQLKSRDDTIEFLKGQIDYLQAELKETRGGSGSPE